MIYIAFEIITQIGNKLSEVQDQKNFFWRKSKLRRGWARQERGRGTWDGDQEGTQRDEEGQTFKFTFLPPHIKGKIVS